MPADVGAAPLASACQPPHSWLASRNVQPTASIRCVDTLRRGTVTATNNGLWGKQDGLQSNDTGRGRRPGVRGGWRLGAGNPQRHQVRQPQHRLAGRTEPLGRRQHQLPAHQRQLRADPLLPEQPDQHRQRRPPAPGLDLPDRREGIDGDLADRGQRRDVRHHLVQPPLRARRPHRGRAVALQAEDGTGHDLLLRPEQPRCRGLWRHGLSRDAGQQAAGARRQDRQAGLVDRGRRPGTRLLRDHGAHRGERQGAARHQRRRVRHPRLRQGVRRQDR